jgi:hypothetical protein
MKAWFEAKNRWLLWLFIAAVGLIEPILPNTGRTILTLYLAIFGFLYIREIKAWIRQYVYDKTYLMILSFFALYGFLLIIIWLFLPNPDHLLPSYANIEELMFNYLLLPFFCILIGLHITQKVFERSMLLFSTCTALFGIFLLYAYFDMSLLFQSPGAFIEKVFQSRFTGGDSRISWVNVFLKNYSFFPTLGALVAIPFVRKLQGWYKLGVIALVAFNILWLSFTINRGTIIGFILAAILLFIYAIRAVSWRKKVAWSFVSIALCGLLILLLPQHVKARFAEMIVEIKLFFTTGHDSGSTSIRLTIWQILLDHTDEFWLFGASPIYATSKLWLYFSDSGYQHYIDSGLIYHSQYLTYFHHFGIIGLLFLPVALFYPIYVLIRQRQISITVIGILIIFIVALVEDRYLGNAKTATLLFFIYFSFFQREKWRHIEA